MAPHAAKQTRSGLRGWRRNATTHLVQLAARVAHDAHHAGGAAAAGGAPPARAARHALARVEQGAAPAPAPLGHRHRVAVLDGDVRHVGQPAPEHPARRHGPEVEHVPPLAGPRPRRRAVQGGQRHVSVLVRRVHAPLHDERHGQRGQRVQRVRHQAGQRAAQRQHAEVGHVEAAGRAVEPRRHRTDT